MTELTRNARELLRAANEAERASGESRQRARARLEGLVSAGAAASLATLGAKAAAVESSTAGAATAMGSAAAGTAAGAAAKATWATVGIANLALAGKIAVVTAVGLVGANYGVVQARRVLDSPPSVAVATPAPVDGTGSRRAAVRDLDDGEQSWAHTGTDLPAQEALRLGRDQPSDAQATAPTPARQDEGAARRKRGSPQASSRANAGHSPSAARLLQEAQELRQAHDLIERGELDGALKLIDRGQARSVADTATNEQALAAERSALKALALCKAGSVVQRAQGQELGRRFLAEHPQSPLVTRVQRECEP